VELVISYNMSMTRKGFLFILFLTGLLPALACGLPLNTTQPARQGPKDSLTEPAPVKAATALPGQEPLGDFSATFSVRFEGNRAWVYQLATRQKGGLREESLHIDGVDKASNPGDVRLVTDGSVTWMIGPGTDNECVQFPNNRGMDPTFILPQSLAPVGDLPGMLTLVGEEDLDGRASLHYQGSGLAPGAWKEARIEMWQAKDDGTLLRFTMQAVGEDPFFGAGEGNLSASYAASAVPGGEIQLVSGCEIGAPLPEAALNIVRLPSMASFEAAMGAADMQQYYQQALLQEGWVEKEAPSQSEKALVLSYSRGSEEVQVQIVPLAAGGCEVKLIFSQD